MNPFLLVISIPGWMMYHRKNGKSFLHGMDFFALGDKANTTFALKIITIRHLSLWVKEAKFHLTNSFRDDV